MKLLALVAVMALGATSLHAGSGVISSMGSGKAPSYGKAPMGGAGPVIGGGGGSRLASCADCFGPGTDLSLYAAGLTPEGSGELDDGLGGGFAISHWYSRYVGTELAATWYDQDSVVHAFTGSLVGRYPIPGTCLAPYIIGGIGYHVNGVSQETYHLGAGLDLRLNSNCQSIFVDSVQTWAGESQDYTTIRAGFRQRF